MASFISNPNPNQNRAGVGVDVNKKKPKGEHKMEYKGYECPQEVSAFLRPDPQPLHRSTPLPSPLTNLTPPPPKCSPPQYVNDFTPMEFEELVEQFDTYDVDGSKTLDSFVS